MKLFRLSIWAVLMASLVLGGAGCKRKPKPTTQIPGNVGQTTKNDTTPQPAFNPDRGFPVPDRNTRAGTESISIPAPTSVDSIPLGAGFDRTKFDEDRSIFKSDTVYFDYDRHAVRASERVKAESVATVLRARPNTVVEIEGHCDERGTEEYNRALGERRALAIREYLINLGIAAERVQTISFGEDRPAEIGSSESAWAKNRRGEFILLTPRQ